jgi:transmembrane sensor
MITPELLKRFLHNECTEEEKERLRDYFMRDPDAWERYLNVEEWEQFEPPTLPEPEASRRWWEGVRKRTIDPWWHSRALPRVAAAATVLLFAGLGWKVWMGRTRVEPKPQAVVRQAGLRRQFNSGQHPMTVYMEDGSTISLEPASEIRYQEPFVKDGKRAVYLDGGASFDVATDPLHPFGVYSGVLETRVLGTSFSVQAFDRAPYIKVLLHTGKVMVHGGSSADVYLLPGQELWYNKAKMLATIHAPKHKEAEPSGNALARTPDWYMFNNQSLAQVFDQLSELYDVRIHYVDTDLRGLYFIGRFEKTDSLEQIMRDIALLNHLTIRKQAEGYIVRKKIH